MSITFCYAMHDIKNKDLMSKYRLNILLMNS